MFHCKHCHRLSAGSTVRLTDACSSFTADTHTRDDIKHIGKHKRDTERESVRAEERQRGERERDRGERERGMRRERERQGRERERDEKRESERERDREEKGERACRINSRSAS